MSENNLSVNVILDNKTILVPFNPSTTAEDVCIFICKQLSVGTSARHLFALRIPGKNIFLPPCSKFNKPQKLDLRIRFRVAHIEKLQTIDTRAYEYFFHQARTDVVENAVPDIIYEKYKKELVGLGITDMFRVMLEKDIPRETVKNEYKKYMPKEVIKRHPALFLRGPIHTTLGKLQKSVHDAKYVKAEYLKQLDIIAPEYLAEYYKAVWDQNSTYYSVLLKFSPFHPTEPGLKYCIETKKDEWHLICTIEELGFVSIRADNTVEICRKNGIPFYLKFKTKPKMDSFITLLDGYYRLTCKWTFNICKELQTPSLQRLYAMKCHGPVGGEFSYAKLEEKRNNRYGCFIIRESESKYNHFYIDVCMSDNHPKTFKLEQISNDEFIFNDDLTRYKSIPQLRAAYNNPEGVIYLAECLPPSEYDKSPLLLCQNENLKGDSLTDSSALNSLIPASPLCINSKNLQVYKDKSPQLLSQYEHIRGDSSVYSSGLYSLLPPSPICINPKNLQVYKGEKKEGSRGLTVVYRSMWKIAKGKKMEVAMKILKQDSGSKYLEEFMELAGQYAFLQSTAIVRLFGITLSSNVSLVLEYFKLGPLDQYLQSKRDSLKDVDLIEAANNLASALWHLKENNIVHGNIRCRKLMVSSHEENAFQIKLTHPGIHVSYQPSEVHWIPVECYTNLDLARRSTAADVWAFATTLWEIFSYGDEIKGADHMEMMRSYKSGKRLPKPPNCPDNIFHVMKECWDGDFHRRKQPQAIMRDINQILYEEYNSRRTHSYAKVFSKPTPSLQSVSSTNSLYSNMTASTFIPVPDDLVPANELGSTITINQKWVDDYSLYDTGSSDMSNILSNFNFSTATTSLDSINSMQTIFELDDDWNVVLQGRVGQGFYGEVYKGTLEYVGDEGVEPKKVAVKKLKTTLSSCLQDFEREINIMKTLKHPNIVEILGVLRENEISLVMEFVQHGSLLSYLKIHRESLHTEQLLKYAFDIAKGMEYLGTKNIVHRDLAARNILVVDENHVKISDFGLAQVIGANDYYILKTNRELPIKWYAPESLRDGKFSVRSDVWSYGVTMCEMFNCGEEPKLTNVEQETAGQEQAILLEALESGSRFPCPAMCPQAVYIRIVYPCWQGDPHKRLTFTQLVHETEDLLSQY